MRFSSLVSSLVGATMLVTPSVSANKLCFVIYQMADNDLEYFIRQDLEEYMQSDLMKDTNTITWVYFDNGDPQAYDNPDPLVDVFDTEGNPLETRTQDVYYLNYNHEFSEMQIVDNLGELNSDTISAVQNFATTAFRDCSEQGATEYMMAFSSHGAGFGGFGGDEVTRRRLGEMLDNGSITSALRSAIDSEIGTGAKLNVLGFDACLMQDYGALDEYVAITENFLASEDVEPGHGWSYNGLTSDSAVNIATKIVDLFASDPQSEDGHQTPKTLAVVDTAAYADFVTKWEEFSTLLTIAYKEDENVQTAVQRARSEALKFAGDTDGGEDTDYDMVDMMDFMRLFEEQCEVSGDLGRAFMEAKNSYTAQFVTFKIGPGTDSRYTGMGILFPSKKEVEQYGDYFQEKVFDSNLYATKSSPNWLEFLRTYYGTPAVSGSSGYCTSALARESAPPEVDGLLMVNPRISKVIDGAHKIDTSVVKRVSSVVAEFGVDLTDAVRRSRRRLKPLRTSRHSLPKGHRADKRLKRHQIYKESRKLQDGEGDYLLLFGGEISGSFSGSNWTASWDRQFVGAGTSLEDMSPVYVISDGESGRATPVLYFPANKPVTSEDVFNMVTFEDASAKGGMAGYITFSTTSGVKPTLYTSSGTDGDSYSETPTSAGGQIVPIVFVFALVEGEVLTELIGGFESVAYPWSKTTPLIFDTLSGDEIVSMGGILTVDLHAEDEDTGEESSAIFEIFDGVPQKLYEISSDGTLIWNDDLGDLTDDFLGNLTDDFLGNLTDDFFNDDPDDPIDDLIDDLIDDNLSTGNPTMTDVPMETDPPTTGATTKAPDATVPPTPGEKKRGTDSSAPYSGTLFPMALAVGLVHLMFA